MNNLKINFLCFMLAVACCMYTSNILAYLPPKKLLFWVIMRFLNSKIR